MPWRTAEDADAWVELDAEEYDRIWTDVEETFKFRPSIRAEHWPSFVEPAGSVTWSVSPLFDRFEDEFQPAEEATSAALLDALCSATGPSDFVYALDWQHPGYRFDPRKASPSRRLDSWLVPTLPDGDYYLFLAADLRFGWITHPWEQTVCAYGALLDAVEPYVASAGWPVVRRGGRVVGSTQ